MKRTAVGALVACLLVASSAAAQVPISSARDVAAWAGEDYGSRERAIAAVARVATQAPHSPRADSVAGGLMQHVLAASATTLSQGYMLNALSGLADGGNVLAIEGLFFFAEVLEPALRAHAIQLLNILPDRARVLDAWRSAATDPNEEVALMAVEMLTYSGPRSVAELQALLDRGAFRNPSARGRARDMIIVLTRQPR